MEIRVSSIWRVELVVYGKWGMHFIGSGGSSIKKVGKEYMESRESNILNER